MSRAGISLLHGTIHQTIIYDNDKCLFIFVYVIIPVSANHVVRSAGLWLSWARQLLAAQTIAKERILLHIS